jgi:hypothetical protein
MGMKEIRAQRRAEADARAAVNRERREREKQAAALEAEIVQLEARQRELAALLEAPGTCENPSLAMETNRKLSGVADALEKATAKWVASAPEVLAEA